MLADQTKKVKLNGHTKNTNGNHTPHQDDVVDISENAQVVLEKRYLQKDATGTVAESPAGMFYRVANAIAKAEHLYGTEEDAREWEEKFYEIMASLEFVPNSPTLMNAGIERNNGEGTGTLSACFVIGLEDHMDGIMTTAKETAMVQKYGGGTGFALSALSLIHI